MDSSKKGNKKKMNKAKDSRFEQAYSDPKFRRIPTKQKKIVIDDRFADMLTQPNFQLTTKVDKRGRPVQHSAEDELKRFYQLEEKKKETSEESDVEVDKNEDKSDDEPIKLDLARGEGNISSSDDDDTSSEWSVDDDSLDEQLNVDWGELDKDAVRVETATRRLAVCNQDWDKIKAKDLLVLFSSFLPTDGSIKRVTVYPSEFGLERMKQEEVRGPLELTEEVLSSESESDTIDDRKRKKATSNRLRHYQLNRLKYFFAVVECDTAATADAIYTQCDGVEYETSGTRVDLRFIPDDTSFDEIAPRDSADELGDSINYRPKLFTTAALQLSQVELTWDETDPDRVQMAKRAFDPEEVKNLDLKDYIASSSGSEESHEEEVDEKQHKSAKYRQLLEGISKTTDPWAKPKSKIDRQESSEEEGELQITWEPGLAEKTKEIVEKAEKKKKQSTVDSELTPFQQYLQRRKEKRKERREQKRRQRESETHSEDEQQQPFSDDEIPDDFNPEDFGVDFKKKPKKDGKNKNTIESDEVKEENNGELELLLANENPQESDRRHFNMKKILKADTLDRKKKKSNETEEADKQQFGVDVKDKRFEAIFSSHLYNIDPSEPQFKRTKGMEKLIEEKHKRLAKGNVQQQKVGNPSEKLSSTHTLPDVDRLVKSVKQKTSNWQSRKKQKV